MDAHNALQKMMASPYAILDPGSGGTIIIDRQLAVVELVSTGIETRTLAAPMAVGIRAVVRMKTDGGDIALTAAAGLNVSVNTTAVFADVGDQLELVSVSAAAGGFRWEILVNTGSVALS